MRLSHSSEFAGVTVTHIPDDHVDGDGRVHSRPHRFDTGRRSSSLPLTLIPNCLYQDFSCSSFILLLSVDLAVALSITPCLSATSQSHRIVLFPWPARTSINARICCKRIASANGRSSMAI